MNQRSRCILIVNPTSGRERALRFQPLMEETLSRLYETTEVIVTKGSGDAKDAARRAASDNQDVFCMGGDGTLNEAINGMAPVKSNSAFGFIPLGTVNDLARALRIPRSPRAAIRMLETARLTRIDLGRINDQYFVNIMAAGLLPEAVAQVTIKEKTRFGSLAYFLKGFQVLSRQKSYIFRVEMDDGEVLLRSSPLIAAMLTDSAGSFRNLLPEAERNKGCIRLALFKEFEWLDLLRQAPFLLTGAHVSSDFVTVLDVRRARISIAANEHLSTNVDGEQGPEFPLDLEILPSRLPVFVPANQKDRPPHLVHLMQYFSKHFLPLQGK